MHRLVNDTGRDRLAVGLRRLSADGPLSLRVNFTWTFFGNVIYSAAQWGMLSVMAKLGSPEMVGTFSLAVAVATPVIQFASMQLRVILATDAGDQFHFDHCFSFRIVTSLLALVLIVGISLSAGYRPEILAVIWAIATAKAFESVSDIVYGLLQKHERMDRIAISKMIKGILSLLVLGAIVWLTGNLFYATLGLAVAWLVLLLTYDLGNARRISRPRLRFDVHKWWMLVQLALPLGIAMMLLSLKTNIPRYFIQHYLGERMLGYYASIAYLLVAGNVIVGALGQSATPRLARYYASGNLMAYRKLLVKLAFIGGGLGLAAIVVAAVAGPQMMTLLYRPDYAQHNDVLVWLMVAGGIGFVASFLGYGMSAAHYFRVQLVVFSIVVAVMVIACFVFVPVHGLLGAAYATILASSVNLVGSTVVIRHALRRRPTETREMDS